MPQSFERVSQSLRADHARGSTAMIVTAVALLTGWLVWALRTSIPLYETSISAHVVASSSRDRRVVAQFPLSSAPRLHVGQAGLFRIPGAASAPYGDVPAHIDRLSPYPGDGKVEVELSLATPQGDSAFPENAPGEAQVEIGRVTPAALLLRSVTGTRGGR